MQDNKIAYHSYTDDTLIYLARSPNYCGPHCANTYNKSTDGRQNVFLRWNKDKTETTVWWRKQSKVIAQLDARAVDEGTS